MSSHSEPSSFVQGGITPGLPGSAGGKGPFTKLRARAQAEKIR